MGFHIVSLRTETPVVLGRWLTLDALLDGVMEREGVPADQRRIPLTSIGDAGMHTNLTAQEAYDKGSVFMASGMIPGAKRIRTGRGSNTEGAADDVKGFESARPRIREKTIVGGTKPHLEFPDETYPFAKRGRKFETARHETGNKMTTRLALDPGSIEWMFQGDGEAVLEIMRTVLWIGAKTSSGCGWVVPDSVYIEDVDPADVHERFGILDATGEALVRPVPVDLFPEFSDLPVRVSQETCWPPYWEKARATRAYVPATIYQDGLVTIA